MSKKLALCVGINDYPGTNSDLSGCVNDADDWSDVLTERGYTVTSLLNNSATYDAVAGTLEGLLASTKRGDRVVFTYSGHGSWQPDTDGDESDGRDEGLCVYDYKQRGLLLDDTLQEMFRIRNARCLIVSDSCHSGSVSRFAARASHPSHPNATPRFLPPAQWSNVDATTVRSLEAAPSSKPRPGAILLSGCQDHEYSYDAWFNGRPNGALTRAAIDTLRASPATLGQWFKMIRATLPNTNHPQTPELTASLYQRYTKPF